VDDDQSKPAEIISQGHGRVIKTIGDEVMFVADSAVDGAPIGLDLPSRIDTDAEFPKVRVGLAYGGVLSRLGDVFGPVVNVAARLTSLARPGSVLVDRGLRDALEGQPGLTLRRLRRVSVRGYARLEPWVLRTDP